MPIESDAAGRGAFDAVPVAGRRWTGWRGRAPLAIPSWRSVGPLLMAISLAVLVSSGAAVGQEVRFVQPSEAHELSGMPSDLLIADRVGGAGQDVFVTIFDRAQVAILGNTSAGGLLPARYTAAPFNPGRLALADLNGNQILDLVLTETESDFVYISLGNADGSFELPVRSDADHDPTAIVVADMNGDGVPDLVVATASEVGGEANVLLGRGDGSFDYDVNAARRLRAQAFDVAVADIDGDGFLDVVVPSLEGSIGILRGDGTGALGRVSLIATGVQLLRAQLADIDGDGNIDIVASDAGAFGLRVLLGDGNGDFAMGEFAPLGSSPWSLRLADVNGDGVSDAVVAMPGTSDVGFLLGRGDGTFAPAQYLLAPFRPFAADAFDLDDDGYPDLITASQTGVGGALYVMRGGVGGFSGIEATAHRAQVTGIAVSDFDFDGMPDIVIGSGATRSVSAVRRNAQGGYRAPVVLVEEANPVAIAFGDLDGDGRTDIVAAKSTEPFLLAGLANGDGTYADPIEFHIPWVVDALAVGDLDGDGLDDVAVRINRGTEFAVALLYGPLDQDPPAAVELAVEGVPAAVAIVDFDGDGILDVAVGNSTQPFATVFVGEGSREWGEPLTIGTTAPPVTLTWGDVDGDGGLDLLYGVFNGVRVQYGEGGGEFSAAATLFVPGVISAIALRDLTGDLLPEVLAVSQSTRLLVAHPNHGERSFGSSTSVPLGANPAGLTTADLDGDGRYDVITYGGPVWAVFNDSEGAARRGDGNGDGRVGAADIVALLHWLVDNARRVPVEAARSTGAPGIDSNGDGWIDHDDLRALPPAIFRAS